jgi:uncharacterized phage infection (PIP) family protein YhgE
VVNQNVQDAPKKFQETKNKEHEETQKQINELRGALNKHESETENTINTEINELKMKIKNIKEKVTQDMENLRKNYHRRTQNTVEGPPAELEQVEDRISEFKDKTEIKEKTEEMLLKQLRSCERICKNSPTPSKDQT